MKHIELENELRARMKRRRIIEGVLSLIFLIVTIVFAVLYGQSMVVEEISIGPIKHQTVTYNHNFTWGILVGALGLVNAGICWICDLLFTKLETVQINGDFLTFYRGILHTNLYVNGEQKAGAAGGYYLEATLSDGTKVNVALGKWSAHMTFSNGHPPIDV